MFCRWVHNKQRVKEGMNIQTNTTHTATLLYELQQLLIQIQACSGSDSKAIQESVSLLSHHGLQLLHYALFAIESQQSSLPFTSVGAGATVHEVMQELQPLAAAYGATITFDASPNLDPVYTNKTSLKGSIYGLLAGVITGSTNGVAPHITVAVQQTKPMAQRIGVYSSTTPLDSAVFTQKHATKPARMGYATVSHRSGLGFLVSQILTERLQTQYTPFAHKTMPGVGFYLPESAQLQLV